MNTPLKTRVTPHFSLTIVPDDGEEPKEWKLAYTYKAIAKIEETIHKDIKRIADWSTLSSGKDWPVVVWGGLDRFNPEVTLDEVIEVLNPEVQRQLEDIIFELLYPGVIEATKKALEEKEKGATADPNSSAVSKTA